MQGLTEGRMTHFVMPDGQHRPALVVRTFDGLREEGTANLLVFLDGDNDATMATGSGRDGHTLWRTSVKHDADEKQPGTWHWIERA